MNEKVTAMEIKYVLMCYFRFERQCLCASECIDNDVMVVTKKGYTIDIEVKINKQDLWKGEAKKIKHRSYKINPNVNWYANKFYICVPIELLDEAEKWVNAINNKYGIMVCSSRNVLILKKASFLHKLKSNELPIKIMMRVCSENIGLIGKRIKEKK